MSSKLLSVSNAGSWCILGTLVACGLTVVAKLEFFTLMHVHVYVSRMCLFPLGGTSGDFEV